VYINKKQEEQLRFWKNKDTNILLIVTRFKIGNSPLVERFHNYNPNRLGNSIVCSYQDLTRDNLTLNTLIVDVDLYTDYGIKPKNLTRLIGDRGVFPILMPYATLSSDMVNSYADLLDKYELYNPIVNETLRFEMMKENTGSKILQTCYCVCFKDGQDEKLKLDHNLRVVNGDGTKFTDCSYVVYEIRKKFKKELDEEISQKSATLLAELKGKGERGKMSIDFLKDTIYGYSIFQKVNRIKALEVKLRRNKISDEEKDRLKTLKVDPEIQKYLLASG
ncbi:MAG: hypothetical protein OEQ12_06080, partial [Nitrosopumilus sp.]|nr:hypothetical protein [Nitrosopumilus sp.]